MFCLPNWVNTSVPTYLKSFINSIIVQKEEGKKKKLLCDEKFWQILWKHILKTSLISEKQSKMYELFFVSWLTKWFIATMRYFDHIYIKQVWTFNWKNKNNSIRKINFEYLLSKRHWTWPQNTRQVVILKFKLFTC